MRLALTLLALSACGGPISNGGASPAEALIVIAPHPDDESACGAASVHRLARDAHRYVRAIYLSGGDRATTPGDCNGIPEATKIERIVALRENEARGAWRVLAPDRQIALDFLRGPDQRLVDSSSMAGGVHDDQLSAAGAQVQARAVALATDLPPSVASATIITTSLYDAHPDHRTAYHAAKMATDALRARGLTVALWSFIVHDESPELNPPACCVGDFHWPSYGPRHDHDHLIELDNRPRPPLWDLDFDIGDLADLRLRAFKNHQSQIVGNPELCMPVFIDTLAQRWSEKLDEPFYRE